MACPDDFELVERRVDRVLTQYRESPKLLHLIRTYLRQVEIVAQQACDLPSYFDIGSAVGDQLTLLGKRLGWPRCHCVCTVQPVYGFECGQADGYPITGFCDDNGTWIDCDPFGVSEICIADDELYRKFLQVRCYQIERRFDLDSLTAAIRIFWGEAATVLDARNRKVVIAPGRDLTAAEESLLQLYPRVLPLAPGISARFHFHSGYEPVFGFGDGWGGFCEEWLPDGAPLMTEAGAEIVDENNAPIMTGPLTRGAPWMCAVDVHPYDCA